MKVFSVRVRKIQWVGAALAVVILAAAIGIGTKSGTVAASVRVPCAADTDEARKTFLAQFGWTVEADPVEICEVIIPAEFNDVYLNYNALQKHQGFDLSRYCGKRVKRWTYEITNYPNAQTRIFADLLVYDGKVIGGGIGTREPDGFMHTFRDEEMTAPEAENATSAGQTA